MIKPKWHSDYIGEFVPSIPADRPPQVTTLRSKMASEAQSIVIILAQKVLPLLSHASYNSSHSSHSNGSSHFKSFKSFKLFKSFFQG